MVPESVIVLREQFLCLLLGGGWINNERINDQRSTLCVNCRSGGQIDNRHGGDRQSTC